MIGLYILNNSVRAVDIIKKSDDFSLIAIQEMEVGLDHPGKICLLSDEENNEYIRKCADAFKSILNSNKGFVSLDASVVVDIQHAFIHTVPFDGDFSPENIKRVVEWELSKYYPDLSPSEFIFQTYNPGFNPAKDLTPKIIFTALLRSFVQAIRQAVSLCNKKLAFINIDLFSVENLINLNTGKNQFQKSLYAIFFRKQNILHCSLLGNRRLIRYEEFLIKDGDKADKYIEMFIDNAPDKQADSDKRAYYFPPDEKIDENILKKRGWEFHNWKSFDFLDTKKKSSVAPPSSFLDRELFAPAISAALRSPAR